MSCLWLSTEINTLRGPGKGGSAPRSSQKENQGGLRMVGEGGSDVPGGAAWGHLALSLSGSVTLG